MAHFAKINLNNEVIDVTTISNCAICGCIGPEHCDYQEEYHKDHGNLEFPETELLGQQVLAESGFEGTWIQTSYNGNFRGTFAASGMIYNEVTDEFVFPNIEEEVTE